MAGAQTESTTTTTLSGNPPTTPTGTTTTMICMETEDEDGEIRDWMTPWGRRQEKIDF